MRKTPTTARFASAAMLVATLGATSAPRADALPELQTKTENFDEDAGWEGRFNRVDYHPPQQIVQNYGFDPKLGEIGGEVWRSHSRPSWYATDVPRTTLNDRITFSGRFRMTQMDTPTELPDDQVLSNFHQASDAFIGFFNSDRQGWRPQNWLGIRFRALRGEALVECTYTTQTWRTGPSLPDDAQHVRPNNQWHAFVVDYDPSGNQGDGTLTLTVDDETREMNLHPNHKVEGAIFNRFGIRSNQIAGRKMTVYYDDLTLTINGKATTYDFDSDPGWEEHGNRAAYPEEVQYGENDFGYSRSNHAGGAADGEAGGRFWNVNPTPAELLGQYGDASIGTLNMDTPLHVSGKIALRKFDTDGSMLIGYYNSKKLGSWPENFIGILIDGPARTGRFFRPLYGNAEGAGGAAPLDDPENPPLAIEPYSRHDWSLDYDPTANDGNGALTVTLDGRKWTVNLKPEHRAAGAAFDRFGMLNEQRANGNSAEVFIDDLKYTVARDR